MRQCPICKKLFEDSQETCSDDRSSLPPPDALLGRVVDGKYEIRERLGTGGQGTVYLGSHVHLQRSVAFKVVRGDFLSSSEAVERFKREALALALVKHPNIVTIYDYGIEPSIGAYIVMEYLAGHSLRQAFKMNRRMPPAMAIDVVREACRALQAAHDHGIVHRDVKPDNIFLEIDGDRPMAVRVLDFGLAKLRELPGSTSDPLTVGGKFLGTPLYMSPEHLSDDTIDARADIYSLGCVLYEALTGQPPFHAQSFAALVHKQLTAPPTPPSHYVPELPPSVDAVVLRSLAKVRDERYQSARELESALASIVRDLGSSASRYITRSDESSTSLGDDLAATYAGAAGSQPPPAAHVRGATSSLHNLPVEATSFVGRAGETREVVELLDQTRLVTLTGPGGSGKTRLSLHVAATRLPEFVDGVWLVELAALADGALVAQTVAAALRVREESGRPLLEAVTEFLRSRSVLLILDNCEHVVGPAADLAAQLLRSCPSVKILATSQEALGVLGESVWTIPPLSLPDAVLEPTTGELVRSEAARLFLERAKLASPKFAITSQNALAVSRVCRSLDGIPLAIELAAARVKMLTVEQIAERLDDRFKLLTGGGRTTDLRQRTLRGAMEWSYELLGEPERVLFDRLSVFAGGFTLEAAEAVCSDETIDALEVFDLLARLVDKSLVVVDEHEGSSRYRLLQTIRQYGRERLQMSADADAVRASHRDWCLGLAEEAESELLGPDQARWLERISLEHDNLRAALEMCRSDASSSDSYLRLAGALNKFWYVRNFEREGIRWLEDALSTSAAATPAVRAKALAGAGALARVLRDYDKARIFFDESLALRRELGDPVAIANSLNGIGILAQWQGDLDRAEEALREALELARAAGDRREIATSLNNLGVVARYRGETALAEQLFEESLALYRALGDKRFVAGTLNNLGIIAGIRGDYELSAHLQEEHLVLRRELGERRGIAAALNNLGETRVRQGELGRARAHLRESLGLYKVAGDLRGLSYLLESFIGLASAEGQSERTLQIAGATEACRAAIGLPLSAEERVDLDSHVQARRADIGDERADAAFAAGLAMAFDEVIALALDESTDETLA